MKWLLGILSVSGFNFTFWALMGLVRILTEKIGHHRDHRPRHGWGQWNWLIITMVTSLGYTGVLLVIRALTTIDDGLPSTASVPAVTSNPGTRFEPALTLPHLLILCVSILTGYLYTRLETMVLGRKVLPVMAPYILTLAGFVTFVILTDSSLSRSLLIVAIVTLAILGVTAGMIVGEYLGTFHARRQLRRVAGTPTDRVGLTDVAAIIAAHNEEVTIGDTVGTLMRALPRQNIFVGSDASTDQTVKIVRSLGVAVIDLRPNRGKAKTIVALLEHFSILDRFKAVMIVDADVIINRERMEKLLPMFDDPAVSATVGRAVPKWFNHIRPRWNMFVTAYRIRVWRSLQYGLRMGQSWKYINVTPIIPGGSSIYRSSVLRHLQIDAPGLEIEDFNMTFEVHHKKLGKIVYNSAATIIDQEPYSIRDFITQIRRWYLGFWQTVFRHGFWPSWFWFTMASFTMEMFIFSVFLSFLPIVLVVLAANGFTPIQFPSLAFPLPRLQELSVSDLLVGIFLIDYLLTIVIAVFEKKPALLLYGLGFFFLRYLDALVFVITLPMALFTHSRGQWVSPKRQAYTIPSDEQPRPLLRVETTEH